LAAGEPGRPSPREIHEKEGKKGGLKEGERWPGTTRLIRQIATTDQLNSRLHQLCHNYIDNGILSVVDNGFASI